jgi:hypothetical protein
MQVVFCTTVKNRTQHLRLTLPQNLRDNPTAKFVVLDYNTDDDLHEFLYSECRQEITAGRLILYTHLDEPVFRMAHAKNLAHRCGMLEGGNILVNLDADNMTGKWFDRYLAQTFDLFRESGFPSFLFGHMIKGEMPRGISGRIAVTRNAFLKAGGYDEAKFTGWGSDDKDFNLRLKMLGYQAVSIAPIYLNGVPHNNKIRFKEYPHLACKDDSYFTVDKSTVKSAVVNAGRIGCGTVYRNLDFTNPIELAPLPTRIFGIGMHKTATTSLHHAFEILGYDSWHWSSAHAAKLIWREINNDGRSSFLERYMALCDLPIPMLYKQLDAAYPGSKFVLTVRDEREWLQSVRKHFDPRFNQWQPSWNTDPFTHRVHNLLYGRRDFDAETMLARYRQHNAEVEAYFRDRPGDLLITNGSAGWGDLCRFLDQSVPDVSYPRVNAT